MKKSILRVILVCLVGLVACNESKEKNEVSSATESKTVGQSGVKDETSKPNVVQIAVGSKDHTTLVAALQAAALVDVLSNAGPFTVFAPTNAAFDQLPAGVLTDLLKPENKEKLATILQYHVYVGVLNIDALTNGRSLGMVDGGNIKVSVKNGKTYINGNAEIVASIPATNGVIHVVNQVLLPPK